VVNKMGKIRVINKMTSKVEIRKIERNAGGG
jgi:hypothetical protein